MNKLKGKENKERRIEKKRTFNEERWSNKNRKKIRNAIKKGRKRIKGGKYTRNI